MQRGAQYEPTTAKQMSNDYAFFLFELLFEQNDYLKHISHHPIKIIFTMAGVHS